MRVIMTEGEDTIYGMEPITSAEEATWQKRDRDSHIRDVPEELYARYQRAEAAWKTVQEELYSIKHTYPPVERKAPFVGPR